MMAIYAHHVAGEDARRDRTDQPTSAARGILIGCGLSACLWVGIVAGAWALLA